MGASRGVGAGELPRVKIPTAKLDEEDLALEPERGRGGDHPGGHLELVTGARVGEGGFERGGGGEDRVEEIGAQNRITGGGRKGRLKEAGLALRKYIFLGAEADAIEGGRGERGGAARELSGAARTNGVLSDEVADLKGVFAGDADRHRDLVAGVKRVQEIGDATAPAGGGGFIGDAVLPLDLLVAVREELRRERDGLGGVLGLGRGIDERAGVGEEGGLAGVEEILELGDARMQAPSATVGGFG